MFVPSPINELDTLNTRYYLDLFEYAFLNVYLKCSQVECEQMVAFMRRSNGLDPETPGES